MGAMADCAVPDIATALPEDAAALAALHGRCCAPGWPAGDFARHIATDHDLVLVARSDAAGNPCGLVVARLAADEADILTIAVAPEHRRRGIARALLHAAYARLAREGVRTLFLEVGADNRPARALYGAFGFRPVGRRAGYYRDARFGAQEDAVLLRLDLSTGRE